jgi:hypothetical protein
MISPYYEGSQGEQYAVPGLAALLMQRNNMNQEAWGQLDNVARGVGAGVVGAVQAYQNPQAFGDGTSSGFAALKGAAMNYNNATTGTGQNFKQFAAMGKAADSVREALKANTPTLPGEQPKVMGYTDDEWKHIGTDKQVQALSGFQQALQAKTAMQAYDMGQQHLLMAQQQMAAEKQQMAGRQKFAGMYQQATAPQLNAGTDNFSMFANLAGGNAVTPGATVNGQQMMDMAIRAGLDPRDALEYAKGNLDVAKAKMDLEQQKRANIPQDWTNPTTQRHYTLFGNTILPSKSDEELTAEAQARANAISANARLRDISGQLAQLYKTPNWQNKPDIAKKISDLEAERNGLFSGSAAGNNPAPANNSNPNDPLGLYSK